MSNVTENPNIELDSNKSISELRQIRFDKLDELRKSGRDPYKEEKYEITNYSNEILTNFDEFDSKVVSMAGRIRSKRIQGKAIFIDLQDKDGRIQLYIRQDKVNDEFEWVKKYDLGDIIGIKGEVFRTQRGEISVRVFDIKLLSKSLQILPEKWHGLKDIDLRYRQRYVDLIVNEGVKETFLKRNKIIKTIRKYLDDLEFLEVETPILNPIAGGATAKPFVTHHNTLDIDLYMRIALELHLKRLVVGGFDRVYEIGKMFRNEGMSVKHSPEFTMMEVYAAYEDYTFMMELTEKLVLECVKVVNNGNLVIKYQDKEIDFSKPWRKVSMHDLVLEKTGVDFYNLDFETAKKEAERLHLEIDDTMTIGHFVNLAFEQYCEADLIQPTFVTHHPVEISTLSKKNPDDDRITNRFEAFVNGWEIANAYSELNDPIDQKERFEYQESRRANGDEEAHSMDEDFINALEVGMPPTAGLGIGIDRLIMILTNSVNIRDIILFPTMKNIDK